MAYAGWIVAGLLALAMVAIAYYWLWSLLTFWTHR